MEVIDCQSLSIQVFVSLAMISKNCWQFLLLIEELHKPEPGLCSNLLTTAQHISYRLCGILSHIPCKSIYLFLETRC